MSTRRWSSLEGYLRACNVLCLVAESCLTFCDTMDCSLPGSSVHGILLQENTLLQEILPTQGSNPGLPHCRQIIYHPSHQQNPRILEWVAYPFFRGTSQLRNWTVVSCIALRADSLLSELPGNPISEPTYTYFIITVFKFYKNGTLPSTSFEAWVFIHSILSFQESSIFNE